MKEDIITNNFIGDDGFGDIMFEGELETEMFRHQASIEEPLNKTNDISKLSTIDQPKAITDSTLERSRIGIVLCVLISYFKVHWHHVSVYENASR